MNTIIIVAIIGATATCIAPIVTLFIKNYFDNKEYIRIKGRSIVGKWKGEVTQEYGSSEVSYKVTIELKKKGKKLLGTCRVEPHEILEKKSYNLVLNGALFTNEIFKIDYKNKDSNVKQFGTFLMKLLPEGDKIIGRFVGFGVRQEKLISGRIDLSN